jgi:predicted Zn-dependent peptidase
MNTTHEQLRAALARVTESNDRAATAERSIGLLTSTIESVEPLQEALDALTLQDAAAFEAWARAADGSDAPEVDVAAHDAARLALVAAQARAAAVSGPLNKLLAEKDAANHSASHATASIGPLGLLATMETRVPELQAQLRELRSGIIEKQTQIDAARALLIDYAESLKETSPNSPVLRDLYRLDEQFGIENKRGYELPTFDPIGFRASWTQAINQTIMENA